MQIKRIILSLLGLSVGTFWIMIMCYAYSMSGFDYPPDYLPTTREKIIDALVCFVMALPGIIACLVAAWKLRPTALRIVGIER